MMLDAEDDITYSRQKPDRQGGVQKRQKPDRQGACRKGRNPTVRERAEKRGCRKKAPP